MAVGKPEDDEAIAFGWMAMAASSLLFLAPITGTQLLAISINFKKKTGFYEF